MGHINFENLVKISKKEEVREMPKILKHSNTTWNLVSTTNRQKSNSRKKNTVRHVHWNLYTLIYVVLREQKA